VIDGLAHPGEFCSDRDVYAAVRDLEDAHPIAGPKPRQECVHRRSERPLFAGSNRLGVDDELDPPAAARKDRIHVGRKGGGKRGRRQRGKRGRRRRVHPDELESRDDPVPASDPERHGLPGQIEDWGARVVFRDGQEIHGQWPGARRLHRSADLLGLLDLLGKRASDGQHGQASQDRNQMPFASGHAGYQHTLRTAHWR
jgi:hypothetical protein